MQGKDTFIYFENVTLHLTHYMYKHSCIHIHPHTDTYIHTYIHTSIYTHTLTILPLTSSLQPLREMADKIKEEVTLGNTDDLITDLNEEREPLSTPQSQALGNSLTEFLGTSARVYFKGLTWENGRTENEKLMQVAILYYGSCI